jgi:hypothetical protein
MMEDTEIIEAPRRSLAWAFCKVVALGAAVGALTWGGSETMAVVREHWPLVKAEATTRVWEVYDSLDRWLVTDQELIEMYARQGKEHGMVALITGIAQTVPGAQFKSCTGYDRRALLECEVGIVRECYHDTKTAKDKSLALYATLGCLGGATWQQAAMRQVNEVLIEEKV